MKKMVKYNSVLVPFFQILMLAEEACEHLRQNLKSSEAKTAMKMWQRANKTYAYCLPLSGKDNAQTTWKLI